MTDVQKTATLQNIKTLLTKGEWAAIAEFRCSPPFDGSNFLVQIISSVDNDGTECVAVSIPTPKEFEKKTDADEGPDGRVIFTDRREQRPITAFLCERDYYVIIGSGVSRDKEMLGLALQLFTDSDVEATFERDPGCDESDFSNASETSDRS